MDKKPTGMLFSCCLTVETLDSSGELVKLDGLDISDWERGRMELSWEHQQPENNSPLSIVGSVIFAKKIYKLEDCDDADQRRWFKKVNEIPFVYGICRLLDEAQHVGAMALAAIIRDGFRNDSPCLCGVSIEGSTLARDPNDKNIITKSIIRRLSVTTRECNKSATIGLLSDPQAPPGFEKEPGKVSKDVLEEIKPIGKGEYNPLYVRIGGIREEEIQVLEDGVQTRLVKAVIKRELLRKAITAGMASSAPGSLTGGSALQKEDSHLRNQVKAAIRDYDFIRYTKQGLRKHLAERMPQADEGFLDYFTDKIDDIRLKGIKKAEVSLNTPVSPAGQTAPFSERGEHALPGSLPAEGYSLTIDNESRGHIGMIHRAGQVVGEAISMPGGRIGFQWAGGQSPRHGLEDGVRAVMLGHTDVSGKPYQDKWSEASGQPGLVKATQEAPQPLSPLQEVPGAGPAPHQTYEQGVQANAGQNKNIWVKQAGGPASNSGRTLMAQFASPLLQTGPRGNADDYFDKLYSNREGYHRPADFWELPQWQTHLKYNMPDQADSYIVRDPKEFQDFANKAGYKNIAFSALDVNKDHVKEFAKNYPGHVVIGGYTDMSHFAGLPNVSVHPTMQSFVESEGLPYRPGYDYSHFAGTKTIPRLTLSQGCKHNCTFCTVPKNLEETPRETVMQQVDEFAKHLPSELVYLNDKTFGQAENHKMLPEIYDRIRAKNPNFKGFVVQTTAAQMRKMDPEFLKRSGIKQVELGVESYNDPILREHKKPANEQLIDEAAEKLRQTGIHMVPNIMTGLPGENAQTYQRTMDWLEKQKDIISHVNMFNLALYNNTEMGKKLKVITDADRDENVVGKSFHADPQVHQDFHDKLTNFSSSLLDRVPFQKSEVDEFESLEKSKGAQLDEQGVLTTSQGEVLPLHWPSSPKYKAILKPDNYKISDEKKETYKKSIHEPWERVMNNWMVVNEAARQGKLPKSVIKLGAVFAAMSPNTGVPIQERSFGHVMDMIDQGKWHVEDPITPEVVDEFSKRSQGSELPRWNRAHYEANAPAQGNTFNPSAPFTPQANSFQHVDELTDHLVDLFGKYRDDGRSIVSDLMHEKSKMGPGKFIPQFGPKLVRYTLGMLGAGNIIVPDRHLVYSLFDKNASDPGAAEFVPYMQALNKHKLWGAIDQHFFQKHPAVKHVLEKYPEFFKGREEQATFPAFWLHWISIPHYDEARGRGTLAENKGSDHKVFWDAIGNIMNKHGFPLPEHEDDSFDFGLNKAEGGKTIGDRALQALGEVRMHLGEIPAQLAFFTYITLRLMAEDSVKPNKAEPISKAQLIQKFEALTINLRKATSDIAEARKTPTVHFQGKEVIPGTAVVPHTGQTFSLLGEHPDHFIAVPEEKVSAWNPKDLVKLPKRREGKKYHLVSPPADPKDTTVIDSLAHGNPKFMVSPEQHNMINGADVANWSTEWPSHAHQGVAEGRWVKMANGRVGFVKHDRPQHEGLYHNLAHQFFGLGQYVPTTAVFANPGLRGAQESIQQMVEGASHEMDPKAIKKLGDSGELDKLALMDAVMGQADRHQANYVFSKKAPHLHLIDNGRIFKRFAQPGSYEEENWAHATGIPHFQREYAALGDPAWEQKQAATRSEKGQPSSGVYTQGEKNKFLNELLRGMPIHDSAAKWLMELNPRDLEIHLRKHGVENKRVTDTVKRLTRLQYVLGNLGSQGVMKGQIPEIAQGPRGPDDWKETSFSPVS